MGTHCYIAEEKDNDMYRSIYCHLDGYPEEVGKLLVKYYDTTEKLRELLALGDVYCLQKKLNPDPSALHCFGNYQKDVTVAFGRDREENGFEAKDRTLDEMLDSSEDPEFVYIFTAEQEWEFCHLYDYDVSFRKVRDVLSKESPGEEDAEPEKGQKVSELAHIERREKGMSTRSMIAKQIAEDEYLAVYCHQDGYLSHNGALLLDCYNTPEKVDALLALGELSHLGKDMEAAPHEIADLKGMEGVTVAYCRDRGEAYRKPESYTLEELCSETPSVYQYVFTLEHAWKYHYGSKGTALSDVQKDLDAQYAYYGLERPESYYGRLNEGIAREMTEGQAESQGPALTM